MDNAKVKPQHSASPAGAHFFSLYHACERKFYIRFGPPRIEPIFVAAPLIGGAAFHAGKAEFYTTESDKRALALARDEIKSRKREFETQEEYLKTLERIPAMLNSWINEWGKCDLKYLNILAVEKPFKIALPGKPSWYFTGRIDMIAEDKYDNILVYETKTSSWSIKATLINLQFGDQATAYLWGIRKLYKKGATALVPDITFMSNNASDLGKIVNYRGDFIYREESDIAFYSKSIAQKAVEISQKMKAVYSGHDPAIFSRGDYYCNAYARKCEYADFCRENITASTKAPPGYRKAPGKFSMNALNGVINDNIMAE